MSLKKNFSVGVLSSIWSALLALAVVPLYLRYLGLEAYGLIGLFTTTQALLQLLDLGLSPTVNRELARCNASGNMREARRLLHTVSIVYWIVAVTIAIVAIYLSPLIANHWLQAQNIPQEKIEHALMLMGLVVASRWPVSIYMGAMMGMQRVALSSIIAVVASTLSSLGAVAVLIYLSPTIEAFFIWQATVGVAYAFAMRWITWRVVGRNEFGNSFSLIDLKRIWRFSAGMSGIAITGVILAQLDKIILSSLLSLENFGRYMLAVTVASGLYVLLTPLFNAIYPRMTILVASQEYEKLADLYKTGTRVFLSGFFPIVLVAALFSEDLLYLWTRNEHTASETAPIATLLLLGTALNGVMHFPFALQLAYGSTRLPLKITTILTLTLLPLTVTLTLQYGAIGGASAWLIMNAIYVVLGTILTHKYMLQGEGLRWILHCVVAPLMTSFLIIDLGKQIAYASNSHWNNILWGICFALVAVTINLLMMFKQVNMKLRNGRNER